MKILILILKSLITVIIINLVASWFGFESTVIGFLAYLYISKKEVEE